MKKNFLILVLLFFTLNSFAQKEITITTCEVQYGSIVLGKNLMDGEAIPFVSKFVISENYFKHSTNSGNYIFEYVKPPIIKKHTNIKLTYVSGYGDTFKVNLLYLENKMIFEYSDGSKKRISVFRIDKLKYR